MNPALSVIFFTTLSGAGFGLLAWCGISMLLLQLRGNVLPDLHRLQLLVLCVGLVLATVGLLFSLGHLGQPRRAWRALSQWRTSWLSREGVAAIATLALGAVLVVALWTPPQAGFGPWLAVLGAVLALLALLTVVCTAMIYASLKPIPAWRHPLVVPGYLLFALVTGLALLFVAMMQMFPGQGAAPMLMTLSILGVLLCALKWLYWYETDQAPALPSRGAAIGLPSRKPSTFERPHTEENYITREMAFQVARRHGTRLRWLATALVAGGPLLCWLAGPLLPTMSALVLAALLMLAGTFVERWLFFAQARHVVTQYY